MIATFVNNSILNQIAGIDFGTSNSSVGVFQEGNPELLELRDEGRTVPSAIFYSSENSDVTYGRKAIASYAQGTEGRLLRSLKSVLGTALMKEKTQIRNSRVAFTDIIGDFFGFLKNELDERDSASPRGAGISSVVLGRPVHFVDDDEEKDREAESQLRAIASSAGFENIEFQLEPIAAALNYESTLAAEELVVIVDIGGGTADFSVLRLSPERHLQHDRSSDVLATMGVHIGGTDFDRLLSLHSVMPQLGFGTGVKGTNRKLPGSIYFDLATWHRIPLLYNPASLNQVRQMKLDAQQVGRVAALASIIDQQLGHALARSVESAKIELSSSESASVSLKTASSALVDCAITRVDMELAIGSAITSLTRCVDEGLAKAGVQSSDIVSVFYTGGSSSVPCLRLAFEQCLPGARHTRGDIFGSVGLGLTIDAARRFA
ncbi:MAG: Hsp70 family protein [Granulosicoccus sp.]